MRNFTWLLILLAVCASTRLWAEELQLKDGTKITGKLVAIDGDTFQVQTAYGDIKVPRSQVVTITFPENQPRNAEGDDAPAAVDESLDGVSYVNRTANFQATVPAGWKLAPEMRKNKEIIAALESPDETLFFLVTPESFAGTLTTYKVLAQTQFKAKFADYQEFSESDATVDGRPGLRFVFQGRPDKVTMMKCLVYIVPYEGRMVRLSFLTLEPLFGDAVPTFEKVAASYRSSAAPEKK
ncbi:MAG TPA: hypothetical protein VMG31_08195 [Verrucomicrobiae bacterium]|nr:hypothetical protein [Verrucomicrobiae bacterium]